MASKRNSSALNDVDEVIRNVHTRTTQLEEILTQVRENCQTFVSNAKQEANNLVDEAKQKANNIVQRIQAMKHELEEWEEEKQRIASTHNFESKITLDVGGHSFATTVATLTRFPDSKLGAMFSGRHALIQDKNGTYFIDRDGTHFREILNFLRGSSASTPDSMVQLSPRALEELKVEAEFYGIKQHMFHKPEVKSSTPETIQSKDGHDSIVTQGEENLWYIRFVQHRTPRRVTVCNHCGGGYIQNDAGVKYGFYSKFTTGRVISDKQPRHPRDKCHECSGN